MYLMCYIIDTYIYIYLYLEMYLMCYIIDTCIYIYIPRDIPYVLWLYHRYIPSDYIFIILQKKKLIDIPCVL